MFDIAVYRRIVLVSVFPGAFPDLGTEEGATQWNTVKDRRAMRCECMRAHVPQAIIYIKRVRRSSKVLKYVVCVVRVDHVLGQACPSILQ